MAIAMEQPSSTRVCASLSTPAVGLVWFIWDEMRVMHCLRNAPYGSCLGYICCSYLYHKSEEALRGPPRSFLIFSIGVRTGTVFEDHDEVDK